MKIHDVDDTIIHTSTRTYKTTKLPVPSQAASLHSMSGKKG